MEKTGQGRKSSVLLAGKKAPVTTHSNPVFWRKNNSVSILNHAAKEARRREIQSQAGWLTPVI